MRTRDLEFDAAPRVLERWGTSMVVVAMTVVVAMLCRVAVTGLFQPIAEALR